MCLIRKQSGNILRGKEGNWKYGGKRNKANEDGESGLHDDNAYRVLVLWLKAGYDNPNPVG